MDHNPYKPPEATVADRASSPRPPQVARACWILWAMLIIGLISLHPSIRGEWWTSPGGVESVEAEAGAAAGVVLAIGVALGILLTLAFAGLLVLVGRRHNWARWTLLVYLVLGWVLLALDLPTAVNEAPPAAIVIDLLSAAAEAWAVDLLFADPAAQWFRD